MRAITLRGVEIGAGVPKICAPIVAPDEGGILESARAVAQSGADLAEWRLDHFAPGLADAQEAGRILALLREVLGEMPLILTVRTQAEGGMCALAPGSYAALLSALAGTGLADCIDVEFSAGGDICRGLISAIHASGGAALLSSHDFSATPARDVLLERFEAMRALGADIAKLAVMPRSSLDVAALLSLTAELSARADAIPLITMSMAGLGLISRLSGEVFGSAVTFGSVGAASAPGQIDVSALRGALDLLHGAL